MPNITLPTNQIQPGIQVNGTMLSGGSHPPQNMAAFSPLMVSIAAYSPMKNIANFMEENSVWNPAINSDSASGRSKGARLVSAIMAMVKMLTGTKRLRSQYQEKMLPRSHSKPEWMPGGSTFWVATMLSRLSEPAMTITHSSDNPIDSS